ncbi:MAG: hypothetical protein A2039_02420 [Candidatus Melainabacteria bacterium GWA2_34_9]|nr:MAG: hypothetical protein A2039_02420 [Candidatus Melainabacteria bacterium GWA2_34_9]
MVREYKLETNNLRNQLKSLAVMEKMSLTKLKILINEKYDKTDTLENLTNKLRNKTVKATELFEILDILGYEVILRRKF